MAEIKGPLTSRCGHCGSQKGRLRCGGCDVMRYCNRQHQVADRPVHKGICKKVSRMLDLVRREEQKLRAHPGDMFTAANPFENSIGNFWGIYETRSYMRARFGLVDELLKINTLEAVQSSLNHFMDMLRLCRGDNLGVRHLIPALYLRLGRDQDCYDFIKWYETQGNSSTYDWGDMALPFLDVVNADVFESASFISGSFINLSNAVAVTLLKIRLLLDLKDLQSASQLDKLVPQEVVDNTKQFIPRTTVISGDKKLMSSTDYTKRIEKISSQIDKLYITVNEYSPYFWIMLNKPGRYLESRPEVYSPKSIDEAQLILHYSFDSWNETPGALEMIKLKIGDK